MSGEMRVHVTMAGSMDVAMPGGPRDVEVPDGTTTAGLLELLRVFPGPCLYVLNGEVAGYDHVLHDGDRLRVSRMAQGG
jgi:sulfur carrier protein ThiS